MKSIKEYTKEDLLKETEQTLGDLQDIDKFLDIDDEGVELASANIRDRFIESDSEGVDFKLDGYAEITISKDKMHAWANFLPPAAGKDPLELDYMIELLHCKNISYGILWEAIKNEMLKCNTERVPVNSVLIARGKPAVAEIPAHFVFNENLLENKRENLAENDQIDFRQVSHFILVKAGDVLAKKVPTRAGMFGITVLGDQVPYETEHCEIPKIGKNIVEESDTLIAACDGKFEVSGDSVSVSEVLHIEKNVDYSTGHIDFPGDVILSGQIQDGFKVQAGGSIICSRTIDASEIICEKDLIVKLGIIGRKKGCLKVGGKIKAKFIENCYVESQDTIYLSVGIMNSAIYTSNRVELEKRGVIIGGTIFAQNGITAMQIGSEMGPRTEIYCGIDYMVANKLEWIRDNNLKLALKLKQIEDQIKTAGPEKEQLIELRDKIKGSIHKLNEAAGSLLYKLDKNENAEVVARGNIYPGVYIEICHISYVVGRVMTNTRFRLDKKAGKITAEQI